jgi:hypothetical protein
MRLLLTILFVFPYSKVLATIEIKAECHRPTDLFALMDGVSKWGFNDKAYYEYWIDRHGILSVLDSLPKDAVYIIDDVHREPELDLLNKFIDWHGGNHEIHTSIYDSGKIRQWASISPNGGG